MPFFEVGLTGNYKTFQTFAEGSGFRIPSVWNSSKQCRREAASGVNKATQPQLEMCYKHRSMFTYPPNIS